MPGFRYCSGFNCRVWVGKRSGYSPGFRVFGWVWSFFLVSRDQSDHLLKMIWCKICAKQKPLFLWNDNYNKIFVFHWNNENKKIFESSNLLGNFTKMQIIYMPQTEIFWNNFSLKSTQKSEETIVKIRHDAAVGCKYNNSS